MRRNHKDTLWVSNQEYALWHLTRRVNYETELEDIVWDLTWRINSEICPRGYTIH